MNDAIVFWFILVIIFTTYVAIDIRTTPEATVMKFAFVVITAFSGPFGAMLYVLSCKEPLPDTHEQYVSARWRQVAGSTSHCVAGDGIGILVAAGVAGLAKLPLPLGLMIEYAAGFLFGWTIFQALFMKDSSGGSYIDSLRSTAFPEFLSMNGVMAGMIAVMVTWMARDPSASTPLSLRFWFVMSIALSVGYIVAYPINWWLVSRGLKHGMMTVRPPGYMSSNARQTSPSSHGAHEEESVPAVTGSHGGMSHGAHEEESVPAVTGSHGGMSHGAHEEESVPAVTGSHGGMSHETPSETSALQLLIASMISLSILGIGVGIASAFGNL